MKITKGELIALFNGMSEVKTQLQKVSITSTKVYYPIAKNLLAIQDEINIIRELDPNNIALEFNKERIEEAKKYAKKDDNDEFIIIKSENEKGKFDIDEEDMKILDETLENIWNEKYKDDVVSAEQQFSELIQQEVDIELLTIEIDDLIKRLPELSPKVIDELLKIIN